MKKSFTLFLTGVLACVYAASSAGTGPESTESVASNLYIQDTDGSSVLMDGSLTQYDPTYSNSIDGLDARKMSNFSENLGMIRGTTTLVIERRHTIDVTDTIFYKIWNLHQQRNYRLEFLTGNLDQPGLTGYVEDLYLNTKTFINLNGSNDLDFTINSDPASFDMYRFRIIFNVSIGGTLPLTFTSVNAYRQNSGVVISWKTGNENNLKEYTVEKSADGKNFIALGSVTPNNGAVNTYYFTDANAVTGNNYYRVRSTNINGGLAYSDIMKVFADQGFSLIKIFPNPVSGNNIHLQFINQPAGEYQVRLISNFGQTMLSTKVQHPGGNSSQSVSPSQNLPKGMYRLEVTSPGGITSHLSVLF